MDPLRILVFGAHPDDGDVLAGGVAVKWARAGHQVRFVSLTNGDAGHYVQGGAALAQRRHAEAQEAARVAGIDYLVLNNHDAELEPSLENRRKVTGLIRGFHADLVLTHRPYDYHPDHRATGVLVQDSAYMVTVPNFCPLVPHLKHNPVFAYLGDSFTRPAPFRADVVVDIDDAWEAKLDMLHCHRSQFYEWLPYNDGYLDHVPRDDASRRRWLGETLGTHLARTAERFRQELIAAYGAERGGQVRFAEAFEVSEYGAPLGPEGRARLFPF
jgi:LmbE family N-acetylglucosaminyl deacetylase